jgi:predicted SAM-dependent methyltransferase
MVPSEFESSLVRLPSIPDGSVEEIRLSGVYEFLFRQDRRSVILEWRRILVHGGALVIRGLPDFEAIATQYVQAAEGGAGGGLDLEHVLKYTHGDVTKASSDQLRKDVFTAESVTAELRGAGYEIASIERVQHELGESAPLWLDVLARRRD